MNLIVLLTVAALTVGAVAFAFERRSERQAAARAARDRQIELIKTGRAPEVLVGMRERNLDRIHPHEQDRDEQAAKRATAQAHRDHAWQQVWDKDKWSSGFIAITVVLTAAWLFLFLLQRGMDVQIMAALGYDATTLAPVLGTVIALAFAVAGILVTGLLGLHPVLPSRLKLRRSLSITIALLIIVFAIGLMGALRTVAVYRSEYSFGPQISALEKSLAQGRASGADEVSVAVIEQDLADARTRLSTGEHLDRTMTVLVPPLEMLLSAFPLFACELAVAGGFAAAARRAGTREHRAQRRIETITRQDRSAAVDLLTEAGVTTTDLRGYLADLNDSPLVVVRADAQTATPPPPPPPRSEGTAIGPGSPWHVA